MAFAGPPYLTDDPEPTDLGHYEIYTYGSGVNSVTGMAGETDIGFNYGGAPDLQLSAVVPLAYDENGRRGVGNVELGAKYRFVHQEEFGLDISVFPSISLPTATPGVGDSHPAYFLPVWAEKDIGPWSIFGGEGLHPKSRGRHVGFLPRRV